MEQSQLSNLLETTSSSLYSDYSFYRIYCFMAASRCAPISHSFITN